MLYLWSQVNWVIIFQEIKSLSAQKCVKFSRQKKIVFAFWIAWILYKPLFLINTVRLKNKLYVFKTKLQQNRNKIKTKTQQKHNKTETKSKFWSNKIMILLRFCFDFVAVLFWFCCCLVLILLRFCFEKRTTYFWHVLYLYCALYLVAIPNLWYNFIITKNFILVKFIRFGHERFRYELEKTQH